MNSYTEKQYFVLKKALKSLRALHDQCLKFGNIEGADQLTDEIDSMTHTLIVIENIFANEVNDHPGFRSL